MKTEKIKEKYHHYGLDKVLQQLEMYYNFHIEGDPTKQEIKFGEEVENLRELLYKKIIN